MTFLRAVFRSRRGHLLLALASAVLCYVALEAYWDSAAKAHDITMRVSEDRQKVQEILARPTSVSTDLMDVRRLIQYVTAACTASQIEKTAINRIDPREASRPGDAAYLSRSVGIDLRSVSLRQTVTLISKLSDPGQGLWVNDVHLTSAAKPQSETGQELWNLELLLTQIVFSPIRP